MAYAKVIPDRYSPRGEAVREAPNSKPLLIFGGIPGEQERVRIMHEGEHLRGGVFVHSPAPSPYRVEPVCEKWFNCGGCPLMHLNAAGQEAARRALMTDALTEAGLTDVEIGAFHASPDGLENFRYVVKVGFGMSDMGRLKTGAWGRNDRRIVPIPDCNVAAPVLRKVMASLAHWAIELDMRPFDFDRDRGTLRSAVLRASRTTGEVMVTLVAGKYHRSLNDLAEAVAQGVSEVAGVWLHVNDEPGNAIFVRDEGGAVAVSPLLGKEAIEETLGDITYRIGPGDFFQTNPAVAAALYQHTLERLALGPEDAFVDLYSGVGGIALQAAKRAGFVLGVEEVEGAVRRARESGRSQRLNAEFTAGKVQEVLPEFGRRLAGARPVVAVNPARRGLEPGVGAAICALHPTKIAYVSCNPRALARDLVEFRARGFAIGAIELFDMFPNTPHVECVVVLTAADADAPRERAAPRRRVVRVQSGS